jgi:tetratricopeptide (TPR) repeat protein
MSRWFIAALFATAVYAQQPSAPPPSADDQVQLPPEEDKSDAPKQYKFNPLQSNKEISAGDFYFKKGNYNAAANRFLEATKWNDGNAEAWLRLGEADEKNHDAKGARAAYEKYLQLAPDAKNAAEVRKKIEKLKH